VHASDHYNAAVDVVGFDVGEVDARCTPPPPQLHDARASNNHLEEHGTVVQIRFRAKDSDVSVREI